MFQQSNKLSEYLGPYVINEMTTGQLKSLLRKDYQRFMREFGKDVTPGPYDDGKEPDIVLKRQGTSFGRYLFSLNRKTGMRIRHEIQIDPDVAFNENLRSSVMYHESIHSVDPTRDPNTGKAENKGHGKFFMDMAKRVNTKYGNDFVTVTGDTRAGGKGRVVTRKPIYIYWYIDGKKLRFAMARKDTDEANRLVAEWATKLGKDIMKSQSSSYKLSAGVKPITSSKGVTVYSVQLDDVHPEDIAELKANATPVEEVDIETRGITKPFIVYWYIGREGLVFARTNKDSKEMDKLAKWAETRGGYYFTKSKSTSLQLKSGSRATTKRSTSMNRFAIRINQLQPGVLEELEKSKIPWNKGVET